MEYTVLLQEIIGQLQLISTFLQLFIYGFVLLVIIFFGYWFFSRFFY